MSTQVLVVEDERLVAKALQHELEQFGYSVSGIASTAQEAVDKALESRPDVVLMDIRLKGVEDGVDAARRIHARCQIPIIYLSAFSDADTVARAAQTEAFGYLLKPYEERELKTTIEMTLAKHHAEQKLEEAERWLAAIVGGINDAVIASDPDNQIHSLNLAAAALSGWAVEDALGAPLASVCQLVSERSRIVLEDFADRAVCESRSLEFPPQTRLIALDGREVPVEGSMSPIYDSRGMFLGMVVVLRSIAARLEFDRLRQQSEERVRRAQKMQAVGRLAGGLSHRLNKLITVIMTNTSLALAGLSDERDDTQLLLDVEVAAQDAASLVQRLRMLSLFSGDYPGDVREIDLNSLVPECLNEIKPFVEPRVAIAFKPGPNVWPVVMDELLIGQALFELAQNARAAMPRGGQLTVEVENLTLTKHNLANHSEGRTGDFVRLRVSDTGRGVPAHVQRRILEPFGAIGEPERTGGLGLAFVVAVVEQHAGWIECCSEKDRGTQFDLYFPRK
jgi:two-component system, cell cycle sensor histidine kinase and response regulator CckA